MEAKRGDTFIEGIDVIIRRSLEKHTDLLETNVRNIEAFQSARSSEIGRKRFYRDQKGKRKYKDDAMDKAIAQMNTNITHLSDRISVTQGLKKENTHYVDTLTEQLKKYYIDLKKVYAN